MVKKFLSLVLFGFFSLSCLTKISAVESKFDHRTYQLAISLQEVLNSKNYVKILQYTDSIRSCEKRAGSDVEAFKVALSAIPVEDAVVIIEEAIKIKCYDVALDWFKWMDLKKRLTKSQFNELGKVINQLTGARLSQISKQNLLNLMEMLPKDSTLYGIIVAQVFGDSKVFATNDKVSLCFDTTTKAEVYYKNNEIHLVEKPSNSQKGLAQLLVTKETADSLTDVVNNNNYLFNTVYSNFKNYVFAPVKKYVRASDIIVGASIVAAAYGIKYFSK